MMEEVEGGEVNRRGSNCSSRTILISSSGRKQGLSTKTTAPGGGDIDWKRTEVQAGRTNGCLSGEKERRRFLGVDLLDRFLYF